MFGWFVAGVIVGVVALWLANLRLQRRNLHLREEKQLLHQEKQIIIDFVHHLVEAIGDGAKRDELFYRIVHAAVLSTGAMSACAFERSGDAVKGVAVEGLFPPQKPLPKENVDRIATRGRFIENILKAETLPLGETIIGQCAADGKAVFIKDAREDERVLQHDDPALAVRSIIVAPITFRDEILGVLAVANPADGGGFNEMDFSLVCSLAEQAGLAIHNSDLMKVQIEQNKLDFDLAMASSIQGMILPKKFPEVAGLDIHAFYRPAQKIGGDLYDVFRLNQNQVGFAIADVSGKGIPASLLMAICQTNLRHFARQNNSPRDVLRNMNEEMMPGIRHDMFITLIYAVVDSEQNTLTFARAGHERLLMIHGGSETNGSATSELLSADGMALGMVPGELFDETLEERTVPFRKGDIAVFFTDGITEALNREGSEFSNERLAETARLLHAESASGLSRGILSTVERHTGSSRMIDDLTLICVKRT